MSVTTPHNLAIQTDLPCVHIYTECLVALDICRDKTEINGYVGIYIPLLANGSLTFLTDEVEEESVLNSVLIINC